MSETVQFKSKSGGDASGILTLPEGNAKGPGLILIQEWWGLNDHMKDVASRFAKEGFVVLMPDLYHGTITKDAGEAEKLMHALSFEKAVDEIEGGISLLRAHERCNGKIEVTGFCMGGALSLATATAVPNLSAAVVFYGMPDLSKWDVKNITAPVLGHFATRDGWVPPSKGEAVKETLDSVGKSMEVCVYEADHAFANDTRPDVYNAEATTLAWNRTIAFLKQHGQ